MMDDWGSFVGCMMIIFGATVLFTLVVVVMAGAAAKLWGMV